MTRPERESDLPGEPDRRETAEPPEGQQNREREGPGSEDPATSPEPEEPDGEDERVDREADETFPASDPPANY